MDDPAVLAIVLLSGVVAGVVNTLAGGGSLLTLPVLIFAGLPASVANGTNRIAIWFQCMGAVGGFQQQGVNHFRESAFLAAPSVIGAIIGAQFAIEMSDETFEKILGVVMIVVIAFVVWNPVPRAASDRSAGWIKKTVMALVFFGIGFYGGFIQAGVGYLLTSALVLLCGFDLIQTAAVKVFIIAVYTSFAVLTFVVNGQVDWWCALVLSIGNLGGALLGSHIAVRKGENIIRWILVVSVLAMALKLFGVFPF